MDDEHAGIPGDEDKLGALEALPPRAAGFVMGAVVGMVLIGVVWFGVSSLTGHTTPTADQGSGTSLTGGLGSLPSSTSKPVPPPPPSPLQRCQAAEYRMAPALRAAAPAIAQWEVHVGAMNKLVVGEITLQQATAFWNQTRVGAQTHLRFFGRMAHRAETPPAPCEGPAARVQHAPAQLRSCARRVAADRLTLHAAQTALGTWRHHVMAMDMLRMGHLSPAKATQMWLASWQTGVHQIQAYRAAEHAARHSGHC